MSVVRIGHVFLLILISQCYGDLRFANYLQDQMVLQRAPQRAIVWGYGAASAITTLRMGDKLYRTISRSEPANAKNENIWSMTLDPVSDEGPFTIHVSQPSPNGTNVTITLSVFFGDVWLCSGQSNMQLTVNMIYNGSNEIANADQYPKIRVFTAALRPSDTPVDELIDIELNWSVASPTSVGGQNWDYMSAVCWLYGRMIHQALGGRPIGLIATSWGGTAIELWMPPQALKECDISTNEKVAIQPYDEHSPNISLDNSNLFNAMIYPFTRMVIYGVIWYQGEANADYHTDKYGCAFLYMIQYWRQIWNQRTNGITDIKFPFGFVQLSTYTSDTTKVGGFPAIRWHQTYDLGYVPNSFLSQVFMAVALDLRDDPNGIHPRYKHDVAYRLSRAGLAVAYGQQIEYQGPIVRLVDYSTGDPVVNITYGSTSSIEQRVSNGFDICCLATQCFDDSAWVPTKIVATHELTVSVEVPASCSAKVLYGLRYLWRETPCLFKQAAIYSGTDPNLPSPPYFYRFPQNGV